MKTKTYSLKMITASLLFSVVLTGCTTTLTAINNHQIQQDSSSRSWGAWMDDMVIETIISVNINKADPRFTNNHIVVTSHNGIVLIVGQTGSEALKQLAGETAKNTLKVQNVYNELEISGPTSMLVRFSDKWITSKIKTRTLAEKNFSSNDVKVITENGTVYLMGLVTQKQATIAVNLVQQSYGVQKIVKVFEYI
ncbi:MAG: BON domain-containing protein [Endozoicomonadaceae bacterium]|nr:BON domain-containing protein [Endozoicomonadaceae bacterium]